MVVMTTTRGLNMQFRTAKATVIPRKYISFSAAILQSSLLRPRTSPSACHIRKVKRSLSLWTKLRASGLKFKTVLPESVVSATKGSQESASETLMLQGVREVYENQRFYGITWSPPPVLDRAGWTDASGSPVEMEQPLQEGAEGWEVVVTPGTDDNGWQYGTVFHHLEYRRPGGRSSQRLGDLVRRRCWRRVPAGATAAHAGDPCLRAAAGATEEAKAGGGEAGEGAGGLGAGTMAASAALAGAVSERSALSAYEAEAKKRAMKAFMGLVLDLLQRRRVWSIIPWDPSALVLLYRKHQDVYRQLQSQAFERQLFTADQAAPPSPLRPDHRTLLQDMLAAAMHARAAYGYPMAAGHVSSVLSYVKLQTVQQLSFDAIGGVSVEANNEAVGALAGIDPSDILLSQWKNSTYRPCHYVAIDRANQCVVLSIRGSLQVGDLLSDLSAHPMEASLGGEEEGGWVHQGIFTAATYIHCNTQAALEEAGRRCPGWPVLITGHSLGGGVAGLLALLMRQAGLPPGLGPLHCITLGSAAVVSEKLAEACQDYVTSVVVGSDVIPHLSYASVETLLVEASEASPVRQAAERAAETFNKTLNQAGSMVCEGVKVLKGVGVPESLLQAGKGAGGWQGAAADWGPLKSASAAAQSGTSEGLGRLLPFYADEDVMQAAALAAQQAAAAPDPVQRGQQAQPQPPSPPRMIQIIDLSHGEGSPSQGPSPAGWEAAGAAQHATPTQRGSAAAAGVSRDELAAATLGSSAGVEGMFTSAESSESGSLEGESAVDPYSSDRLAQPLPYSLGGGADTPLLSSAMAQEEACGHGATSQQVQEGGGAPAAASNLAQRREAGAALGTREGGDSPEVLYPPGRILWIFPADEDLNGHSGGDAAAVAAGVAAGTAAAAVGGGGGGGSGAHAGGKAGEVELSQAGAAHAAGRSSSTAQPSKARQHGLGDQQGAGVGEGLEELGEQSREAVAEMAAKEAEHAQRGEHARMGRALPGGASGGQLDVDQAVEDAGGAGPQGGGEKELPVVVEADRRKFERVLLMPDMINDHLPDRYLQAIQQL